MGFSPPVWLASWVLHRVHKHWAIVCNVPASDYNVAKVLTEDLPASSRRDCFPLSCIPCCCSPHFRAIPLCCTIIHAEVDSWSFLLLNPPSWQVEKLSPVTGLHDVHVATKATNFLQVAHFGGGFSTVNFWKRLTSGEWIYTPSGISAGKIHVN